MSTKELILRSERLHFRMLDRVFFTEVLSAPRCVFAWHDKAPDYYSNIAAQVLCSEEEAAPLIEEIADFFEKRSRDVAIYTTPFSKPDELPALLEKSGFKTVYRDAWMYFNGVPKCCSLPEHVAIRAVENQNDMQVFVDLFNRAYSGTDPREPYGAAPPAWGESLYSSFGHSVAGREVRYYLLFEKKQPASLLMTSSIEGCGGIYSVGTTPEMRGRGYGSLLTLHAVNQLVESGADVVFLQTEKGSYNEKLYHKIGFSTEWVAEAWHRPNRGGCV